MWSPRPSKKILKKDIIVIIITIMFDVYNIIAAEMNTIAFDIV